MYDSSKVVFIDLTLSPTEQAKLEAKPDKYVKGTFSLTTSDGTPGGEAPAPVAPARPVEIRLKGSVGGSFRDLTKKAAFKLKFKEVDAFLGLRKMTLNNMVQDRSMIHETLAYAAFREAGVPASRTGYAYLRLNGEDFGLYLNLENLDEVGLTRIFGTAFDQGVQHLYEGEKGHDVVPGEESEFEVDEGSEDSLADLEALIDAVNGGGAEPWSARVAPFADLAEMTKMWAVEKYIDHWDGYSGHAIPALRPNNYYLYSDPFGQFQMLPWGTDQTWIPTIGVPGREVTFDGDGGVLFDKCLEDSECFRAYWEALQGVTSTIATLAPGALAEDTASLIGPWEAEERAQAPERAEYDADEVDDGVEETLDFISGRRAEADEWLAMNTPPPKPTPSNLSAAVTPPPVVPPAPTGSSLLVGRIERSGKFLTANLDLWEAGFVSLRATMNTPKGDAKACGGNERADRIGPLALRCQLSAAALTKLGRRSLPLTLTVRLTLPDGRREVVSRQIKLPRDRSDSRPLR